MPQVKKSLKSFFESLCSDKIDNVLSTIDAIGEHHPKLLSEFECHTLFAFLLSRKSLDPSWREPIEHRIAIIGLPGYDRRAIINQLKVELDSRQNLTEEQFFVYSKILAELETSFPVSFREYGQLSVSAVIIGHANCRTKKQHRTMRWELYTFFSRDLRPEAKKRLEKCPWLQDTVEQYRPPERLAGTKKFLAGYKKAITYRKESVVVFATLLLLVLVLVGVLWAKQSPIAPVNEPAGPAPSVAPPVIPRSQQLQEILRSEFDESEIAKAEGKMIVLVPLDYDDAELLRVLRRINPNIKLYVLRLPGNPIVPDGDSWWRKLDLKAIAEIPKDQIDENIRVLVASWSNTELGRTVSFHDLGTGELYEMIAYPQELVSQKKETLTPHYYIKFLAQHPEISRKDMEKIYFEMALAVCENYEGRLAVGLKCFYVNGKNYDGFSQIVPFNSWYFKANHKAIAHVYFSLPYTLHDQDDGDMSGEVLALSQVFNMLKQDKSVETGDPPFDKSIAAFLKAQDELEQEMKAEGAAKAQKTKAEEAHKAQPNDHKLKSDLDTAVTTLNNATEAVKVKQIQRDEYKAKMLFEIARFQQQHGK